MFRRFFFNDTATTEIYTLSLHDALPISLDPFFNKKFSCQSGPGSFDVITDKMPPECEWDVRSEEHTSELQSQFRNSYAVFCLIKKTVT